MGILNSKFLKVVAALFSCVAPALAQRDMAGTRELELALKKLNVLGSVLMIAAHPDDENSALLAYFARGRGVRTAYLSLTRGEGGQNLIGPEQGALLGVIRTQELLAARKVDGAEQLFTRAIDFGFSKTAEEAMSKWGHDAILSDIVWDIRRFRPDVIILRFSGTPRDGHGQHQVSAILGKEAFSAAADPHRFPEQLHWVQPWQAKRLLFNAFSFTEEQEREAGKLPARLEIDTGAYNPMLGYSYGEIAGMSRSMHHSQGVGSPERRGDQKNYLIHLAGEAAARDPFDGIDTTWSRIPGGAGPGSILAEAASGFSPQHPEKTIPLLLKARPLIAALKDPIARRKLEELDETIGFAAGLWLDASADTYQAVPGASFEVRATAINRSSFPLQLESIRLEGMAGAPEAGSLGTELAYNQPATRDFSVAVPATQPYSQPYWLENPPHGDDYAISNQLLLGLPEDPPVLRARFRIRAVSESIELVRPVWHRYVDRLQGEITRPLAIVPPVALRMPGTPLVFPGSEGKKVDVQIVANAAKASGQVTLEAPPGWRIAPSARHFDAAAEGEELAASFEVFPPVRSTVEKATVRAVADLAGKQIPLSMVVISYPHIPTQTLFQPAVTTLVHAEIRTLVRKIGYVMGAGDDVPEALRQLGCEVTLLGPSDLAGSGLSRFDAIVTGVRAYNVRPDLRANQQRLLDYVQAGGTLVVQYNVLEGGFTAGNPRVLDRIGPYPMRITHDRVTVEDAPVKFPNPDSPLLHSPNKIGPADFDGWIQERGLYFASEWDKRYKLLFESHDPGEEPLEGGTLYARYGKGAYVFTAYSWFRELPAGVPGAYRIFANLLSAGKTLQ
jgi:LmbE family N-acetylglucosaminyl deacetylase